jgi:GAF domain-containing protein
MGASVIEPPADGGPLYQLAMALAAALTPDEVVAAVVEHAGRHIGATQVMLWLFEQIDGQLALVGQRGLPPPEARKLAMAAVRRGHRRLGPPSNSSGADRRGEGHGPGVVQVAVPLISRGLTVGALGLALEPGHDLGERLAFVDVVSGLCSTALDRALLYVAEHEARQTLEFLAAGTQLMISAVDPDEVVDHLVHLAVPRLGDWCTAYLVL